MRSRVRMEQHLAVGPQRMPLLNEDARILALETGPIRGHTLKVLVLEDTGEPLSVVGLRRQLAERLSEEARWAVRLVSDPSAASGLAWEPDPNCDVGRYVEVVATRAVLDEDGLRGVIADA